MISQRPFWLLTIAIISRMVLPILLADGMFMEGQQYSCIAKNMANGIGNWWHPIYTDDWEETTGLYAEAV
jgi:hypothetical protein